MNTREDLLGLARANEEAEARAVEEVVTQARQQGKSFDGMLEMLAKRNLNVRGSLALAIIKDYKDHSYDEVGNAIADLASLSRKVNKATDEDRKALATMAKMFGWGREPSCWQCGYPMAPPGEDRLSGEYHHARSCPLRNS
jgi:hypothetical protein